MKKIIPYLLLFGLLYGAWYYWQSRPKPPLVANLLPYASSAIKRISVHPENGPKFSLSAFQEGWIIEGMNRSFSCSRAQVAKLIVPLLRIRSSGLATKEQLGDMVVELTLDGSNFRENIRLYTAPDSFPKQSWLLQLNTLSDVYVVEQLDLSSLPIQFNDYRSNELLNLLPIARLDSLVWWQRADSSRVKLLTYPTDSIALDSLLSAWSPYREAIFADFFGEISDANTLLGQYLVYGQPNDQSAQLTVYTDARWAHPFVLKGSGPEYFAVDSLGKLSPQ